MDTIGHTIRTNQPLVAHRLWVLSDLQQSQPERATYCMTRAVDDFLSLHMPVEAVCYLGDAVEGHHLSHLEEMTIMQERQLARVDVPVFYVVGNHDFDYFSAHKDQLGRMTIPFVDHLRNNSQWHLPKDYSTMYYMVDMGDYAMCFLTDHADPGGAWYTSHGLVRNEAQQYMYGQQDYDEVKQDIARQNKPVLTLSHYAMPGGNREAPLFKRLLPLPDNVLMHFYGHAHIGDAVWAGKDCHRKIAAVDGQPLVQVNVASLENFRGNAIRSVLVELYQDGAIGVLFRNHSQARWDDYLITHQG